MYIVTNFKIHKKGLFLTSLRRKKMGECFPMMGGNGAYSYTNNSQFQKQGVGSAKTMIQEAIIEKLDTETLLATFRIADYGCSVGPNTFVAMETIIQALENKLSLHSKKTEFQVFFIDHTENDFNTLYALLPVDRKYHAAGVPGSFYGRVFPRDSINLAFSSYAVHWLSKIPEGLSESKSPAWNRGRIFYAGASRDVVKAYSDQFGRDMGAFLSARAEEIVKGGLMVLIIPGIPEGLCSSQLHFGAVFNHLGSCLLELADEGVIDKSKIDAVNVPEYFPTLGEMRNLVEKNGCFTIEKMVLTVVKPVDAYSFIMNFRAGLSGIFIKHFGAFAEDKLFAKALAKAEQLSRLFEAGNHISPQLFLALKRR